MPRMRAQDRRRQLLEVAADLFARHGYRGTTTARLAEAAGITEPILYRHFRNKHDLFVTLIDEVSNEVIEGWQGRLEALDDPAERLRALLASNPSTHTRGRGIYRVIFQAMSEVEADVGVAKPLRRHLGKLHEFICAELTSLQERAAVRGDQPAAALAWLLIHLAVGYGMVSPLSVREPVSRDGVQATIESLLTP